MEPGEYAKMARLQREHWWFEVKRRLAAAMLRRYATLPAPARVLEVGCGTGAMLPVLRELGPVVGVDREMLALVHLRDATGVAADANRLPFADAAFHLVAAFDVLYHRGIPDVDAAVAGIARVTKTGGYFLLTDSAGPGLYGAHDRAHHGARRFRIGDLRGSLQRAGFEPVHASYFHTAVWPAVAASRVGGAWLRRVLRLGESEHGASQLQATPGWLSAALLALYGLEIPVAVHAHLPVGVSLVMIARRR